MKSKPPTSPSFTHMPSTLFDIIFVTFLSILILHSFITVIDANESGSAVFLLAFNGFLSILGQLKSIQQGRQLSFIGFFFSYFFMSVAPMYQLSTNFDPIMWVTGLSARGSLLALLFTSCGIASLFWSRNHISLYQSQNKTSISNVVPVALLTLICCILSFALFGSALFTSRQGISESLESQFDSATALLLTTVLMLVPFYGSVLGLKLAYTRNHSVWIFIFATLLLTAFIINNPLTTARFKFAGLIIFVISFFIGPQRVRPTAAVMCVGLVLAPMFHVFRSGDVSTSVFEFSGGFIDLFATMDYDAFSLLCYTIHKVDLDGVQWGSNLLGALLFFVPRRLWPDKPLPSSSYIAEIIPFYRIIVSDNLSTPIMAEGYFALGIAGAFVVCCIFWTAIRYLENAAFRTRWGYPAALLCGSPIVLLLLLRGTLIVGVAYLVGTAVAIFIPWRLLQMRSSYFFIRKRRGQNVGMSTTLQRAQSPRNNSSPS